MGSRQLFLFSIIPFCHFVIRILAQDLSIDTDEWGILLAGRLLLDGHLAGDPNKILELGLGMVLGGMDRPEGFPLLAAVFGALTCSGLYALLTLFCKTPGAPVLGWGIVVLSPVLYWQVLSANSLVFAACFLIWSLYCYCRSRFVGGCVLLALAGLSRPEPFILLIPVMGMLGWRLREGKGLGLLRGWGCVALLMVAPAAWLVFNWVQSGDPWLSFKGVQAYNRPLHAGFGLGDFPSLLYRLLREYYFQIPAALGCVASLLYFLPRIRELIFPYAYLLFTLLGYALLSTREVVLIERMLLPVYFYLVFFMALLTDRISGFFAGEASKRGWSMALAVLPLWLVLALNLNFAQHREIGNILEYHAGFDRDIGQVVRILERDLEQGNRVVLLVSARRESMLRYYLYDRKAQVSMTTYTGLFRDGRNLRKDKVNWVVYAPNDLFPPQMAFYSFDLLSPEGMTRQSLKVVAKHVLSDNTQLWRVGDA